MFTPDPPARALPPVLSRGGPAQPSEPSGAVAAIGRRINALSAEHDALDNAWLKRAEDSPEKEAARERMGRLFDEILGLYEEAGRLRAETLADLAVQALGVARWAEYLNVNEVSAADVREASAKIRHVAAGMAVALARIGRFDLGRLGDVEDADFCARELDRPWPGDARSGRRP